MRIFRSDDGAELREEDVRDILGFCELATDAFDRIVAALAPKPKLFSKPGVEIPCKVEVGPDGATTWTPLEKLTARPGESFTMVGESFTAVAAPEVSWSWKEWATRLNEALLVFVRDSLNLIESFGYTWDSERECWLNRDGSPATPPKP